MAPQAGWYRDPEGTVRTIARVVIEPQQATAAEKQRMADARASLWVR